MEKLGLVKGMTKYEYNKDYFNRNKSEIYRRRKERVNSNLRSRLSRIIGNAKLRREVLVSVDYLEQLYHEQEGLCAISGEIMTINSTGSRNLSNQISLDRIDNSKGYTEDNVQLVTAKVNMARGVMSLPEFINLCKEISQWNA